MNEVYQKTISKKISFQGVGLHSGKQSSFSILPADEDKGIVFKRTDINQNNIIKANFNNVFSTKLCTTLKNDFGVKIATVEHLLAALYIAGIDNALIEINCEEVPIMDGSAKEFLSEIKKTNLLIQRKKRKYLKISKKIELKDGERKISIEPNTSSLKVNFQLKYKNKVIGNQKNTVDFEKDSVENIFNSRTFCLLEDTKK